MKLVGFALLALLGTSSCATSSFKTSQDIKSEASEIPPGYEYDTAMTVADWTIEIGRAHV